MSSNTSNNGSLRILRLVRSIVVICLLGIGSSGFFGCDDKGTSYTYNPVNIGDSGVNINTGGSGGSTMPVSGSGGSIMPISGSGGSTAPLSGSGGSTIVPEPMDSGIGDSGTQVALDSGQETSVSPVVDGGYPVEACVPVEPTDLVTSLGLALCTPDICPAQESVCVEIPLLESTGVAAASIEMLGDCSETEKCVPIAFVNRMNKFIQPTCRSLNNLEGRCLSTCVPDVARQASGLPKDICGEAELCTPCYDPRTGEDTGACHQGCDPGPTEPPPEPFVPCCDGRGLCVPPALAGDQADSLQQDSCVESMLCAPAEITDLSYVSPVCSSLLGAEGRCLSTCVPLVAEQIDLLPGEGCGTEERCAPCFDPRTGEETGACRINGDAPVEEPVTFDRCCEARGLCVPPAMAGDQAGSLAQDTCETGMLCAPEELTDPSFKPAVCSSIAGFEGRCVSTCLGGQIAEQKDTLPTEGCATSEVCAPCTDPISGEDTGACRINGDAPNGPAETFERCCDNTRGTLKGVCIPPELAGEQAEMLKQDTCQQGLLCAPITKAQDPSYEFPSCWGVGAGACVPTCILDQSEADLLSRVTCEVGEVCAPCANLGIFRTGACD